MILCWVGLYFDMDNLEFHLRQHVHDTLKLLILPTAQMRINPVMYW
jgi:hypothetical protein